MWSFFPDVAVQLAFRQRDAPAEVAIDLRPTGLRPALPVVEAYRPHVGVEDPEAGVGEAVGPEPVDRSRVQPRAPTASPRRGVEVERVELAFGGIVLIPGRSGRGEPEHGGALD